MEATIVIFHVLSQALSLFVLASSVILLAMGARRFLREVDEDTASFVHGRLRQLTRLAGVAALLACMFTDFFSLVAGVAGQLFFWTLMSALPAPRQPEKGALF